MNRTLRRDPADRLDEVVQHGCVGSGRSCVSVPVLALGLALLTAAACGGDDPGAEARVDAGVDAGSDSTIESEDDTELGPVTDEESEPIEGDGSDGSGGSDTSPLDGEMATLRMVNLVGVAEGGVDVDVVGPASDIVSDHVYGTVAFGQVAEIEFPSQWDARLVRAGTDVPVGVSDTVYGDTADGQVVVFRDDDASLLGPYHEHRRDGYAPIGIATAIVDADPLRTWRWSSDDGVCLFSVGHDVPAPMATAAEGGETSGILTLGLVGDFVWYVEPGPQRITFADSAPDVFEQGDDCSRITFAVDIDAEAGRPIFVALYGPSDDVRSVVYQPE